MGVFVLTSASNGDEAAAVFNAAFGNMMGIFVSPILILLYIGIDTRGGTNLMNIFQIMPASYSTHMRRTDHTKIRTVRERFFQEE